MQRNSTKQRCLCSTSFFAFQRVALLLQEKKKYIMVTWYQLSLSLIPSLLS